MEFMSNLGGDGVDHPSLFELIAQAKMTEMLSPALRYVYAQRYPRYLIRISNNYDEFYAALMLLVERHYLKQWGGSFAENFYGLKRVPSDRPLVQSSSTATKAPSQNLSSTNVNRSLAVLVILPYIKQRLDHYYSRISGGGASQLFDSNERDERELAELRSATISLRQKARIRLRRIFRLVYPWAHFAYHMSEVLFQIGYLFGKTKYWNPWLKVIDVEVVRMNAQDYRNQFDSSGPKLSTSTSLMDRVARTPLVLVQAFFNALRVILPMSIFFFKFLEWWYSSEFARGSGTALKKRTNDDDVGVIASPKRLAPDLRGIPLPKSPDTCPICLRSPIDNPTALPTGYVFCYTCAYKYVEEHGRCPVTWEKVNGGIEGLRKVYIAVGTGR
ncbi:hypothetical protein BZG36_05602 [Bifiguratus adelaidae]|uniref:Peroxisome assembly protein 12 n=1 Tax=Bifiguratus adelaidae TaxID=1938954 RepID=A0A261XTQ1_9FUNG|nr:hypothetical protein BZG36_05602 [Bifiguratus adelaidae]